MQIRFFDRTKLRHGAAAAGADGRRHRRDPPPLLGFIHHVPYNSGEPPSFARFVRTTAFRPAEPEHSGWWPLDCRHGRALFSSHGHAADGSLTVWDPITGDVRRQHVPDSASSYSSETGEWSAAIHHPLQRVSRPPQAQLPRRRRGPLPHPLRPNHPVLRPHQTIGNPPAAGGGRSWAGSEKGAASGGEGGAASGGVREGRGVGRGGRRPAGRPEGRGGARTY
uniref:Uncharacterized protein n=1 Tax=Oryza rufipogon TaxID=4529 RepID=A0A0E0QSN1_ORYRU